MYTCNFMPRVFSVAVLSQPRPANSSGISTRGVATCLDSSVEPKNKYGTYEEHVCETIIGALKHSDIMFAHFKQICVMNLRLFTSRLHKWPNIPHGVHRMGLDDPSSQSIKSGLSDEVIPALAACARTERRNYFERAPDMLRCVPPSAHKERMT